MPKNVLKLKKIRNNICLTSTRLGHINIEIANTQFCAPHCEHCMARPDDCSLQNV